MLRRFVRKCEKIETLELKFQICKMKFQYPGCPEHAWYIPVDLPDGARRYLQYDPIEGLRLGWETGVRTNQEDFFSNPGWYRTRYWARCVVRIAKCNYQLRCEV